MRKIGYLVIQVLRYAYYLSLAAIMNLRTHRPGEFFLQVPSEPQKIAIHFHVFHLELAKPIVDAIDTLIKNSNIEVSVYMTTTLDKVAELQLVTEGIIPEAKILAFENRGRDVLPFLKLVTDGTFRSTSLLIKVHTKAHRQTPQGDILNDQIALDLLNPNLLNTFLLTPPTRPFIATLPNHIFGWRYLGRNTSQLMKLLRVVDIKSVPWRPKFPAASMFWMSGSVIHHLEQLEISDLKFPEEPIAPDGTLAHAFERFYGLYAQAIGADFKELKDAPPSGSKNAN